MEEASHHQIKSEIGSIMKSTGTLYIVSVPIGNLQDITLRALDILKTVDAIICEEIRPASTLLKRLGISDRPLIELNEHNEKEKAPEIAIRIARGESFALISDCGTPIFADPGAALIYETSLLELPVVPIPGASSLMAALSILDVRLDQYIFGGFLPRQPERRQQELQRLRALRMPIVLMDTPYRMASLLEDVGRVFGDGLRITLALDLTSPGEQILRGSVHEVRRLIGNRKAEFVLILHS